MSACMCVCLCSSVQSVRLKCWRDDRPVHHAGLRSTGPALWVAACRWQRPWRRSLVSSICRTSTWQWRESGRSLSAINLQPADRRSDSQPPGAADLQPRHPKVDSSASYCFFLPPFFSQSAPVNWVFQTFGVKITFSVFLNACMFPACQGICHPLFFFLLIDKKEHCNSIRSWRFIKVSDFALWLPEPKLTYSVRPDSRCLV